MQCITAITAVVGPMYVLVFRELETGQNYIMLAIDLALVGRKSIRCAVLCITPCQAGATHQPAP